MTSSFLHNFVMNALKSSVGSMPDFWVMNNALGWMEKGVLAEANLVEIQTLIDQKNTPIIEPDPELEPEFAEK